ncbi:hypothetical protein [Streptomyces wuyuanensis]|uniref:hypothetical protein n=1 Tax=Streptomyces wuyuanensis TaxID=1196353 RepID=UPI00342DBC9D
MEIQEAPQLEIPAHLRQGDWIYLYTPQNLYLVNGGRHELEKSEHLKRHFLEYCTHYLTTQTRGDDEIFSEENIHATYPDIWYQYLERHKEATAIPKDLEAFMEKYLQQSDLSQDDLETHQEVFPTLLGRTEWYSVDNALSHYQVAFRAACEEVTAAQIQATTVTTEGPQGGAGSTSHTLDSHGGHQKTGKPIPDQRNSPAITVTPLELPEAMSAKKWDYRYCSSSDLKLSDCLVPDDLYKDRSDPELVFMGHLFKRYCHLYATQLGHEEDLYSFCERPLHDPNGPQPDIQTIINQTGPSANSQLYAPERLLLIFTYFKGKFSDRVKVSRRRHSSAKKPAFLEKESDRALLAKVLTSDLVFSMAVAALEAGVASATGMENALFHRREGTSREELAWGRAYRHKINRADYSLLREVLKNANVSAAVRNLGDEKVTRGRRRELIAELKAVPDDRAR